MNNDPTEILTDDEMTEAIAQAGASSKQRQAALADSLSRKYRMPYTDLMQQTDAELKKLSDEDAYREALSSGWGEMMRGVYASDPAMAHLMTVDDIKAMPVLRGHVANISESWRRSKLQEELAGLSGRVVFNGEDDLGAGEKLRLDDLRTQLAKPYNPGDQFGRDTTSQIVQSSYSSLKGMGLSVAGGIGGGLAGSEIPIIGNIAGAFLGAGAASYNYSSTQEAGNAYEEYLGYLKANGIDTPEAVADTANRAAAAGRINGAIEFLPGLSIAKNIPGMKHLIAKAALKEGAEVAGKKTMGQTLKTAAKNVGETMLVEGATEGMQEAVTMGLSPEQFTARQYLERVGESAKIGALMGGGMGLPGPALQVAIDYHEIKRARKESTDFRNLIKDVNKTDLVKGTPEKSADMLRVMGVQGDVTVDAQGLAKLLSPEHLDKIDELSPGFKNQLAEAASKGDTFSMPKADYAVKVGSVIGEAAADHVTLNQSAIMTAAQAAEREKWLASPELAAKLDAAFQSVADPEFMASQEKVYQSELAKHQAVYGDIPAAKAHAQIVSSFVASMAHLTKMKPEEFYAGGKGKAIKYSMVDRRGEVTTKPENPGQVAPDVTTEAPKSGDVVTRETASGESQAALQLTGDTQSTTETLKTVEKNGEISNPEGSTSILYQSANGEVRDLILTHNLTEDNLHHANRVGGIPVPSLAITKAANPLTGFGEITLIGDKALADPQGYAKTKVFGADIYSPRYPSVSYKLDSKAEKKLTVALAPAMKALDRKHLISDMRDPREVAESTEFMAQTLIDSGIKPEIMHDSELKPHELKSIKEMGLEEFVGQRNDYLDEDPKFIAAGMKIWEIVMKDKEGGEARIEALKSSEKFNPKAIASHYLYETLRALKRSGRAGRIDEIRTRRVLRDQINQNDLQNGMEAKAVELMKQVGAKELISKIGKDGERKQVAHTLDNVVKVMSQNLRGGENFNYGSGSIRAMNTPQFKSIDAIKKAKGRLVDSSEFEALKEEVNNELTKIMTDLDVSEDFMKDAAEANSRKAARDYSKNLNAAEFKRIDDYLAKLSALPTEYFEAKITREVDLSEFRVAVIPSNLSEGSKKILRDRGLILSEYLNGDAKSRAEAIQQHEQLFFQSVASQGPASDTADKRGFIDLKRVDGDVQAFINILPEADESTFLHEFGHLALQTIRELARGKDAPPEVVKLWTDISKEFGITGKEITREQHERFARSFEAYLREGKAPTPELQGVFEIFADWLMQVYRSFKDLKVKMNPRINALMDRIVASHAIVQNAEAETNAGPMLTQEQMTPAKWAEYQALTKQATDEARRSGRASLLAPLSSDIYAENSLRREIQAQVQEEMMQQPVYQALDALRRAGAGARISRQLFIDRFGESKMRALERHDGKSVFVDSGSGSIDAMAAKYGFKNAEELVKAMAGAKPLNEAIADAREEAKNRLDNKPVYRAIQHFRHAQGEWIEGRYFGARISSEKLDEKYGKGATVDLSRHDGILLAKDGVTDKELTSIAKKLSFKSAREMINAMRLAPNYDTSLDLAQKQSDEDTRHLPLYMAIKELQRDHDIDKLPIHNFRERFGGDSVDAMKKHGSAMFATEGTADVDSVASQFGFLSGDAMVEAMAAAQPFEVTVKAETRVRLAAQVEPVRANAKELAAARKDMIEIVRAEFESRPIYQLIEELAEGVTTEDGSKTKLSTQDLLRRFGDPTVRQLSAHSGTYDIMKTNKKTGELEPGVVSAKIHNADGALDLESFATSKGYADAEAMIQEIANTPPLDSAIEREAQKRLLSEAGDPLSLGDEAIQAASIKAMHTDSRGRMIAFELQALRLRGNTGKGLLNGENAAYLARERIRSMSVKEANAAHKFAKAETRASVRAESHLRRGEIAAAIAAKEMQLIQHHLTREALQAQKDQKSAFGAISRERKSKDPIGIDPEYHGVIRSLLAKYGLVKVATSSDWLKDLAAFVDRAGNPNDLENYSPVMIAQSVINGEAKSWKDLTLGELDDLRQSLDSLRHVGQMRHQLDSAENKAKRAADIEELKAAMIEAFGDNPKGPEGIRSVQDAIKRGASVWQSPSGKALSSIAVSILKIEELCNRIDKGDVNGIAHRLFWNKLEAAKNHEGDLQTEYTRRIREIIKQRGNVSELEDYFDIPALKNDITPSSSFTREMAIVAALNMGNAGNIRNLLLGRGWTREQLQLLLDKLSAEDWKMVQGIWTTINGFYPGLDALHREATGVPLAQVEAVPFIIQARNAKGEMETVELSGGYYPIVHATELDKTGRLKELKAPEIAMESTPSPLHPKTASGMMKTRNDKAAYPLSLSIAGLSRHMEQTIHTLTHQKAVQETSRILRDPALTEAFATTAGEHVGGLMMPWLQDVARPPENADRSMTGWDAMLRGIRQRVQLFGLGYRLKTVLAQFLGFANIAENIGAKWAATGLKLSGTTPEGYDSALAFALEQSAELRNRGNMWERDFRAATDHIATGPESILQKVQRFAYWGIAEMDKRVSLVAWLGARAKYLSENPGGDIDSANRYADGVIRMTQGGTSAMDAAAFMRSRDEWRRMFALFIGPMNAAWNRLTRLSHDFRVAKREGKAASVIPALMWRGLWLTAIPAVLQGLLLDKPDKDEEDKDALAWAEWTARKSLGYAVGGAPVLRDVVKLATGESHGGAVTLVDSAWNVARKAAKAPLDLYRGEIEWQEAALKEVDAAAWVFKIPVGQLTLMLDNLRKAGDMDIDPLNPKDLIIRRQ